MVLKRQVPIEGKIYLLTISDDEKALLAAAAAGGAVIGIWKEQKPMLSFGAASYLVEAPEDVTDRLAGQVVRRHLGLPWVIGETDRLMIREFCVEDADDSIFSDRDMLEAYIRGQYYFYEYGIWAVVEKQSGAIVGRAGITDLITDEKAVVKEAGYQIFKPYRRKGYGFEAMTEILNYGREELDIHQLYVRIEPSNLSSIRLAEKLGFKPVQRDSGSEQGRLLYAVNLKAAPDKEGLR